VRFNKSVLLLVVILLATPVIAQQSDTTKTPPCSVATLKGAYGGAAEGWILYPVPGLPPPPLAFASVGRPVYDGAGHFTLQSASSVGGLILPWGSATTGTYDVTPDCSFSAVLIGPDGNPIHWAGTITGRGMSQEIHLIYTDPYRVISGTQRRMSPGGCSQETLKGTYGLFGHGFVTLPNLPPRLPANHVGMFEADGAGTFSGSETTSVAGTKLLNTYLASYTVGADCTVSATITNSDNEVFHEVGTITGEGRFQEGHLIVTEPGWIFSETGKK
jgi:hypothetical protein